MLYRKWNISRPDKQIAKELAQKTGVGKLLAEVMVARGLDTPEAVNAMLDQNSMLPDPFLLRDMDKAVERIHKAIYEEEYIVVFGDYDVDGITATALLYSYLESAGANVYYKLPNRSDDGYGLFPNMVEQIAELGIKLIVTVDTGTSAFEAAERAKELGVDIVMTDHHLPQDTLPDVAALVNPHRADDTSPLKRLSGVGVSFMLACALEGCTPEEMLPMFGDFVAIGTVADVMKLTGENRTMVRAGLAALQESERPGVEALIRACGLQDKAIMAENVSYGLAPRLNAAGRMDNASAALQLLLEDDPEQAEILVQHLQEQNTARQQAEQQITAEIIEQITDNPELQRSRVSVVWGEGWHQGVIGIVASRLLEKYGKPSIVISFDGEEGHGSGRSIAGFSLHNAISSCADILERYGGHDLAAGLLVRRENIEELQRRINEWAVENCPIQPTLESKADTSVVLDELDIAQVKELEKLAPYGSGNPTPHFLLENVMVDAIYSVSEGKHCRLRLKQGGSTLYAVMFGVGPDQLAYRVGDSVDALVALSIYEGKMGEQISARLLELRPAGTQNIHVEQSALFETFIAGGKLDEEQRALLYTKREDIAEVYRALRVFAAFSSIDARPLFSRLGEEKTGSILVSLAALQELELITVDEKSGHFVVVPQAKKRDLADSVLLKKLGV